VWYDGQCTDRCQAFPMFPCAGNGCLPSHSWSSLLVRVHEIRCKLVRRVLEYITRPLDSSGAYLPQEGCACGKHEHSINDQTNGDHVPVATGGCFWVKHMSVHPMLVHRCRLHFILRCSGLLAPKQLQDEVGFPATNRKPDLENILFKWWIESETMRILSSSDE